MKVLFINNYPMDIAWELWKNGEYPGHHLWGITHLHRYGIEVDILPYQKYTILNRIGAKLRLGAYLDMQLRVLLKYSQYDLVYSGCQDNTFFLSLLRCMGIGKPIISIVHHPIRGKKSNVLLKGHYKLLCLSKKVFAQLKEKLNVDGNKACLLDWGVDLSFYQNQKNGIPADNEAGLFFVSAGKTHRDHDTLVQAFSDINYPLKLYCSASSAPTISKLPSNISVQYNHPTNNAISYNALLAEYNKAYAIAIPLLDVDQLAGLTSLLDAMAMEKATIMTKNSYVDIDIEKEGIGIWVDPGDVRAWRDAASYLIDHPQEAREMGRRGYNLCKNRYNLESFSSSLGAVLAGYKRTSTS